MSSFPLPKQLIPARRLRVFLNALPGLVEKCAIRFRTLNSLPDRCPYPGLAAEAVGHVLDEAQIEYEVVASQQTCYDVQKIVAQAANATGCGTPIQQWLQAVSSSDNITAPSADLTPFNAFSHAARFSDSVVFSAHCPLLDRVVALMLDTLPVREFHHSLLATLRSISDAFAFLSIFSPPVWVMFGALFVAMKFINWKVLPRKQIHETSRKMCKGSACVMSFFVALFMALYKCGLLGRLLLQAPFQGVQNFDELVKILDSGEITVVSVVNLEEYGNRGLSTDEKRFMDALSRSHVLPGPNFDIENYASGRWISLTMEQFARQIAVDVCDVNIVALEQLRYIPWRMAMNRYTVDMKLQRKINRAIVHSQGFLYGLQLRYRRWMTNRAYSCTALPVAQSHASRFPQKSGQEALAVYHLRGVFLPFLGFLFACSAVFALEFLVLVAKIRKWKIRLEHTVDHIT